MLRPRGGARAAPRARRSSTKLRENTRWFRGALRELGFAPLDGEAAIIPIIVGETARAIELSQRLLDEGVFVTGFGFPVVPEGTARIRVQMSAALEHEHLDRALEAFVEVGRESGVGRRVAPLRFAALSGSRIARVGFAGSCAWCRADTSRARAGRARRGSFRRY